MATSVSVEGVSKSYRQGGPAYGTLRDLLMRPFRRGRSAARRVTALDDVSLEVEHGECLGVIGDNGAGKTTLLKVIARVTAPDAGRVAVRGRVSPLIAVGAGFHPELTGAENVLLHGSLLGFSRKALRAALPGIAAFAGLEGSMDVPVKHLSTGMYARLGFAVAVHGDPGVLLVDEVLSVGDAPFRERCHDRIDALRKEGTAVLFVSHDLDAVARRTDRALLLAGGRAVTEGQPDAVVQRYVAAAGLAEGLKPAPEAGV